MTIDEVLNLDDINNGSEKGDDTVVGNSLTSDIVEGNSSPIIDDNYHAKNVQYYVNELNQAIKAAHEFGLRVRVEQISNLAAGCRFPYYTVMTEITKVL